MGDGYCHRFPLAGGVFSSTAFEGPEGVGEARDTRSREGGRRVLSAITVDQPLVNVRKEEGRSTPEPAMHLTFTRQGGQANGMYIISTATGN